MWEPMQAQGEYANSAQTAHSWVVDLNSGHFAVRHHNSVFICSCLLIKTFKIHNGCLKKLCNGLAIAETLCL